MEGIAQTNIQLYEQLRRSDHGVAGVAAVALAYKFAQSLFAAGFRGSGRPFLCHLVGTASILARDRASLEEVTAGLLHAVYEAGLFPFDMHRTVSPRKRAAVRAVVGEEVEELIAAYAELPWNPATLERLSAQRDRTALDRSLLRLRLANELDDLADDGYTGRSKALLFDDAKRRAQLETLAAEAAMPKLAAGLQAAIGRYADQEAAEVIPPETRGTAHSYTLLPPTAHQRLGYRLACFRRRVERRLR